MGCFRNLSQVISRGFQGSQLWCQLQWLPAGVSRKSTGTALAGASLFWRGPGGSAPILNRDAEQLLAAYTYLPHTFEQRVWTDDEKQALRNAIQQVVQVRPTPRSEGHRTAVSCRQSGDAALCIVR